MKSWFKSSKQEEKKSDIEIEYSDEEEGECATEPHSLTPSLTSLLTHLTYQTKPNIYYFPLDDEYVQQLRVNLSRLIVYAESADHTLQREVAERLANEAVKPSRQAQIVEYGGLRLLVPLTKSTDAEVQRLSAHALANLSVTAENQVQMAREGGSYRVT
jgi:hypothetical protein